VVIACDKRDAFAHGSASDEAIYLRLLVIPSHGLLRLRSQWRQNHCLRGLKRTGYLRFPQNR
jgi:hypothetical protein